MSLRVWLPLNGSLENKGLDDVTVTNNGAVADNNGKIGKCYSFGTGNSYMTVDSEPIKHFTEFSFACWVKIISWNSSYATIFAIKNSTNISWNNLIFSLLRNGSQSILCFNIAGSGGYTSASCHTEALELNTWYHIAGTYKAGEIRLYQDGVLVSTYETAVIPTFNAINNFWIGKANANSYQSNILLNDFRIYDYALSPMEVKQISQGLILHYPLNHGGLGQENLLANSQLNANWEYPTSGYKDKYAPITLKVPTESMYTLSFEAKSTVAGDKIRTHFYSPNTTTTCTSNQGLSKTAGDGNMDFTLSTKWERYWVVYHQNETTAVKHVICPRMAAGSGTGIVSIRNVKLEAGDKPTPWSPAPSDDLYSIIGGDENVEYDCSGYGNNGEYYAYDTNGSISYTSDTPRYNVSTHIASANPTQNAASGTRYLYGHCKLTNPTQMSVAFWLKPITGGYGGANSNGQGYFCTTNYEYGNTSVGADYQASAMNHRDSSVNMNDSASTTQCNVTFWSTIGEWHHYVYTYDGQVGRGYKDGVQIATAQFSTAKTLDSFIGVVIGFSKAGGVWRRNDACYSDFRVYATALSPEDVLDLYNLGAAIDTNNNLYGAMFEEV